MLETNMYVRCSLVDFSKAFDVVNHEILLDKFTALELPPFVLNWIISFLVGRSQICKVGDELSTICAITRGIIQGSGVGPYLYIAMESVALLSKLITLLLWLITPVRICLVKQWPHITVYTAFYHHRLRKA